MKKRIFALALALSLLMALAAPAALAADVPAPIISDLRYEKFLAKEYGKYSQPYLGLTFFADFNAPENVMKYINEESHVMPGYQIDGGDYEWLDGASGRIYVESDKPYDPAN